MTSARVHQSWAKRLGWGKAAHSSIFNPFSFVQKVYSLDLGINPLICGVQRPQALARLGGGENIRDVFGKRGQSRASSWAGRSLSRVLL